MKEDRNQLAGGGVVSAIERLLDAISARVAGGDDRHDLMADALEATGEYRILRRLRTPEILDHIPGGARLGIVLDVETTGIDAAADEIIELAMVPFAYTIDGQILGMLAPFHAYRQPAIPIPGEITALTGITDEMVAGKTIGPDAVAAFIADDGIVIAHNARFDRRFVERLWNCFADIAWGCSMSQVDWRAEGFEGTSSPTCWPASASFTTAIARQTIVRPPSCFSVRRCHRGRRIRCGPDHPTHHGLGAFLRQMLISRSRVVQRYCRTRNPDIDRAPRGFLMSFDRMFRGCATS